MSKGVSRGAAVAMIEPVGGHGGMNYYDFGLCGALTDAGTDVALYTCTETDVPAGLTFEVKRFYKGVYGSSSKYLRGLRFLVAFFQSLIHARATKRSIVHFHLFHTRFLDYFVVRASKVLGFKVVITVHDVESFSSDDSHGYGSQLFSRADALICHNQVSQNELLKILPKTHGRVYKIPHGSYVEAVGGGADPKMSRIKLGLDEGDEVILFFGQIKIVKGLDVLLKSLPHLLKVRPRVKLVIAGKMWKDSFKKYEDLISELNLSSSVLCDIRYIPDDEAKYYYAAADVVALPYKKIYQSGVLLMAMSYRKVVVASDLEGMAEIISDGVNGYLFRSEDAIDLADTLSKALGDSSSMQRIADAGFETMISSYSWSLIGGKTAKVYQNVDGRA